MNGSPDPLGVSIIASAQKIAAQKQRFTVIKNRFSGISAAATQIKGATTTSSGIIYTPYIPLQMSNMLESKCTLCGRASQFTVGTKNGDVELCEACRVNMDAMNLLDILFRGDLDILFPETNPREHCEDGVIWRVPAGSKVFPVYVKVDVETGRNIFYVPKSSMTNLDRDYFCHDMMLFKDTVPEIILFRGGYGLARGEQLYVYQFHKTVYDGTGWVVGFILDGKYLLAHDVEMTDDEHV